MITDEHKGILFAESESRTLVDWVKYFDNQYSYNTLYSFCYRNKLKTKPRSKEEISKQQSQNARKWNINQDYFKTWSRNMAYMFGFWCADGCMYNGRVFDITVQNKDKYIIKQFAKELGYEGPILDYVDRQACRINFSCYVIYNDLKALGGEECKSKTIKFPNVPKEYLSDFIRGYFDGDGSVYDVQGGRINSAFTCASMNFLNSLWNLLKTEAGIEGGSYDHTSYTLKFGKKDSIKLAQFIYKDNPELFLLRKREKFNKFL